MIVSSPVSVNTYPSNPHIYVGIPMHIKCQRHAGKREKNSSASLFLWCAVFVCVCVCVCVCVFVCVCFHLPPPVAPTIVSTMNERPMRLSQTVAHLHVVSSFKFLQT